MAAKSGPAIALLLSVAPCASAEAAVLALKAVKRNGAAIVPTSSLTVEPGDRIEAEILLSGWGTDLPQGVVLVQATIAGSAGFRSGGNGTMLPCGWDAPLYPIACSDSESCPIDYPSCAAAACQQCVGSNHEPQQCAFARPDPPHVFCEPFPCNDVQMCTLDYRYRVMTDESGLPVPGIPFYIGTLIVEASANACGTFTIGFVPDQSFIEGWDAGGFVRVYPSLQAMSVQVSSCVPYPIACQPEHCNIDARIAYDPNNPTIRYTTNTLVMQFSESTEGMTRDDFQVIVYGTGALPSISEVMTEGDLITIVLNQRIRPRNWTCIRHKLSDRQCCMGSMPGDVDWSGVLEFADVFELLSNLEVDVQPPLRIEQCDTDRSGVCAPGDLPMLIDLVNDGLFCDPGPCTLPECPPQNPYP